MNLGNKIRELRKQKNLTQEQLAATLNISSQAVSKWEMGASYPDMTMIPVLAGLFNVSLDELFDFNVKEIDREIERIVANSNKYFWDNFEKAESLLLDGLQQYPAAVRLKTELLNLYAYHPDRVDDLPARASELYSQIIGASQDVFCTCRSKENMILILRYLEKERGECHYDEIKSIIDSLPHIYPYMIPDRMRLSALYIKGADGMREAIDLQNIEWQEFFIACCQVGNRYFDEGNYEEAMNSFRASVDVIERFMYPGKQGYGAYPIGGTHANHAITLLQIAACMIRLGKTDGTDAVLAKAEHVYFDAYDGTKLHDFVQTFRKMISYYTEQYERLGLSAYRPLDLTAYEKRVEAYRMQNPTT